jgi:ATP synthase protein I
MHPTSSHSGEMSQDSLRPEVHRKVVLDPAARTTKRMYETLSMSSVGLEFGIAVLLGLAFGNWLDGKAGTGPWLMILFLVFGFIAGLRGIMRGMRKANREADADD